MSKPYPGLDVSRETSDRLRHLADRLTKWNRSINLVAPSTVMDVWNRHILDSVQVLDQAPEPWKTWADFGSGGGFPGLVVAILAHEMKPDRHVHLVESDQRKATFLRTMLRETGVKATVHAKRAEEIEPLKADVVSARALAPLPALLTLLEHQIEPRAVCLFPKGRKWRAEVTSAQNTFAFGLSTVQSRIDPESVILKLMQVARV